jgi:hypothetical protein
MFFPIINTVLTYFSNIIMVLVLLFRISSISLSAYFDHIIVLTFFLIAVGYLPFSSSLSYQPFLDTVESWTVIQKFLLSDLFHHAHIVDPPSTFISALSNSYPLKNTFYVGVVILNQLEFSFLSDSILRNCIFP